MIGTRQFIFLANSMAWKAGDSDAAPNTISRSRCSAAGTQPTPSISGVESMTPKAGQMRFTLPLVERGAIAWINYPPN